MTYFESAEDARITLVQVSRLLAQHAMRGEYAAFLAEFGVCADYDAQCVLTWMGY